MSDPGKAVFLSYASQDAEAARRIAESLRAAGVEVWFDQSELRGGDVWDHKIRRQIKSCALFVPIISRNALSRDEGYFRLEWRLAEDRTHLMAPGRAFIVPVVIDDAREDADELPEAFRRCQWTRFSEGTASAEFVAQLQRLLNPEAAAPIAPHATASVSSAVPTKAASAAVARRKRKLWPVIAAVVVLLVVLGVVFLRPSHSAPTEAAAPGEFIPRIEQAIANGDWESAYSLAKQIPRGSPDAIRMEYLWPQFSWITSIPSDPPGATVYRRPYNSAGDAWEKLGVTPLENIHFPFGLSRIRIEKEGYLPLERAIGGEVVATTHLPVGRSDLARFVITSEVFKLDTKDTLPAGMVRVPGWTLDVGGQAYEMGDFFLGKYEVTNREYQQFVEAGGYQRREFWEHPFVRDGRALSWEEAMKLFTDKTGRPGPGTWVGGTYPEGQEDFPVAGVSWYEAAACARFLGRELPTLSHWRRAFASAIYPWLLPASNLEHEAPAKVGQFHGMGWAGTYDMAGNVREWMFNAVGEQRLILGGGASDPLYLATNARYAQPPFDRSAINGFRLAITRDPAAVTAIARQPQPKETARDFRATPPVSDEVFEAYRRLFDYKAPQLDPRIEESVDFPHWTRLRVSVTAAYPGERLPLYLYLPHSGRPPFQAVLFWPGSAVRALRSIDEASQPLEFVLRSGRAVVQPVFDNTFDRRDTAGQLNRMTGSNTLIRYVNDCRRTLDYLESRPDIDAGKLAYFGTSWGGAHAPEVLALEPRLRAAVLHVAGFFDGFPPPETDSVTYATRVRIPVLMLNGEYDSVFPLETHARPFFELLGTPAERKEFVVMPGGHFVPHETLVGRSLDWFDRYLGQPVR